jgi:hypothetical protein
LAAASVLALGTPLGALAATLTTSHALAFSSGTQSLWGPGGSTANFRKSGSASFTVPVIGPTLGAGYLATASAGTVSGNANATLSASYDDVLAAPGSANVRLQLAGLSGNVGTNLGARFDVTGFVHDIPFYGPWDFCIACNNYQLDTSITLGGMGTQRTGTDSFALVGVGPDILVASAQLNLNVNQTARFTPTNLTGTLSYTHRDTGSTRSLAFTLSSVIDLLPQLDLLGVWDFSFSGLDLHDTFSTTIGSNLSVDIDVAGVVSHSFPFGNVPLLNTPTFELDFASVSPFQSFSIFVVPEPGSLLLFAAGATGLLGVGRRRSG